MILRVCVRLLLATGLVLLGAPSAFALTSYSDVATTLGELAASSSPDGPRLRVVEIGKTVKGRAILMAVLDAPAEGDAPTPAPAPPLEGASVTAEAVASTPDETAAASASPEAAVSTPSESAGKPANAGPGAGATTVVTLILEPSKAGEPPAAPGDADAEAPGPAGDEATPALPPLPEVEAGEDARSPRRVLFLCRQHGNEPASTEAAVRFLKEYATTDDPERIALLRRVTFLVIPMLNVDGAEQYERRNARNVDLNRDWAAQTQPETQAVVRTVREWRPELVVDAHELHPTDWTASFVEAMERDAGAPEEVGDACNAAIAAVVGPLREGSIRIYARPVSNYREPRLAHRYFAVREGTPAILIETRRAGDVPLEERTETHYQAFRALARHMDGEELGTPPRVIAAWLEPGEGGTRTARGPGSGEDTDALSKALAERGRQHLAGRGGAAPSTARKRAALRKKGTGKPAAKKRAPGKRR